MASITTTAFQTGATVNAYPASNWSQAQLPPSGSPVGASSGSGTVVAGTVTIGGLVPSADYFLHDGSRYVRAKATPDLGLPGLIGPEDSVPGWATSSVALVSGTEYGYRLQPKRDYKIVSARIPVATASGTDDALEVCIRHGSTLAKLATTGALLARLNTLTPAVMPLAYTLLKGQEYYICSMGLSTATVEQANLVTFRYGSPFGSLGPLALLINKAGQTHPLSDPLTAYNVSGTAPVVHLSEI